jgi:serine O-acetyltransferase
MKFIKKVYYKLFMPNINSVYMCNITLGLYRKGHKFLATLMRNRLISKYGIHLGLKSSIGENLRLPHPQGIIIGEGVKVGNNCTIYHNVTLGKKYGPLAEAGYPKIGNNVIIYTGAVILGDITVGDNSIIGANSIVLDDVDANTVCVGIPAKKVKDLN